MGQFELVQRRFMQFGKVYNVRFAVDLLNKLIYIDELTITEIIGNMPTYRPSSAPTIKEISKQSGRWFKITGVCLMSVRPIWFSNWLQDTIDLLERFYLTELENFGDPEYEKDTALINAWEGLQT